MFTDTDIQTLRAIYREAADGFIATAPKITQATLDAIANLPEGFTPVTHALPESEHAVLAIRRSGYVNCDFEIITARYQPEYRPKSPWRDISGGSMHDSGEPILGWRWENGWLRPS